MVKQKESLTEVVKLLIVHVEIMVHVLGANIIEHITILKENHKQMI